MPAIDPARFYRVMDATVTVMLWALTLVATYSWVTFGMLQFPYTRGWGEQLKSFLLEIAADVFMSMLHAIPGLVTVVVIFIAARFMDRLSRMLFDRVEKGWVYMRWIDRDTARPTRKIATVVIWLFALAMAYPYLPGAQTNAFKGLSVLVGLMVSIGASSVVGQAASGLILMYSRAFRVGEYVRIGDNEGTVRELGMFATRIATVAGEDLVIPNSHVLGHTTHNLSRMSAGGYAISTAVTIGYDAPWRQVHALLKEAAERTKAVRNYPAPYVIQTALSDFYVEYRLIARADADQPRPTVLSELHGHILDCFNEHGVQIMSPHYRGDPAEPKVVPESQWYAAPAMLPEPAKKLAG
jgi:small-conductance mechanosensitive channel